MSRSWVSLVFCGLSHCLLFLRNPSFLLVLSGFVWLLVSVMMICFVCVNFAQWSIRVLMLWLELEMMSVFKLSSMGVTCTLRFLWIVCQHVLLFPLSETCGRSAVLCCQCSILLPRCPREFIILSLVLYRGHRASFPLHYLSSPILLSPLLPPSPKTLFPLVILT